MSGEPEVFDEEYQSSNGITCNLDNIYENLKDGILGDDDVDLIRYIAAYKELYNFFLILGGAFQFIATDIKSKIKIIEDLQNSEKSKQNEEKKFSSVKKMILHEKGEKLLDNQKYVSGSRTLLRLHRGLDFVRHFFKEIYELDDSAKLGSVCRETYDKTLASYHTWVVKNSARLAMKLLPTREALLKKITRDNPVVITRTLSVMPQLLEVMKVTYDRVQTLYSRHQLLDLP